MTVDDDQVVEVGPDLAHPVTEAYFCVKALANAELLSGADGLAHSVERDDDGAFSAVGAFAAINEVGDRIGAIVDEHGPRSVGIFFGTGGYFNSPVQPLAKASLHGVGSPNLDGLSWTSKPFAQYAAPRVSPPPGVIDETHFFRALPQRMSMALEYRKIGLSVSYADAPPVQAVDMYTPPDPEQFARWWLDGSAIDFDSVRAAPGGIVPALPEQRVEAVLDDGARLDLCSLDVAEELAATLADQADPARPYRLTTRRLLTTMNSAYRNAAPAARRAPLAQRSGVHDIDNMSAEALADGDRIEIGFPSRRAVGGSVRRQERAPGHDRHGAMLERD